MEASYEDENTGVGRLANESLALQQADEFLEALSEKLDQRQHAMMPEMNWNQTSLSESEPLLKKTKIVHSSRLHTDSLEEPFDLEADKCCTETEGSVNTSIPTTTDRRPGDMSRDSCDSRDTALSLWQVAADAGRCEHANGCLEQVQMDESGGADVANWWA